MRRGLLIAISAAVLLTACGKKETPKAASAGSNAPAPGATAKAGSQQPGAPAAAPAGATGTEVGQQMPAYSAKTIDGKEFDLASEKGSVVFLNVWATWCGPCRFEIPELQKMNDKYGAKGFKVIGVSIDEGGAEPVKQFVADQKVTYPMVVDPDGKLANVLQTSVIPTSVVLDRNGKIVWKKFGALTGEDPALVKAIEDALAAK